MSYAKAVVEHHHVSGLPKDNVVNTYTFVGNDGPSLSVPNALAVAGRLAANLFDAINPLGMQLYQYMSDEISRVLPPTISVYDIADGGSPRGVATMLAIPAAFGNSSLPGEVAACLAFRGDYGAFPEFAADDADPDSAPERPRSRVRGRIYFGPLHVNAMTTSPARPSTNFKNALVDLGVKLLAFDATPLATGDTFSWAVYSKEDDLATVVESGYVDDAFDTQRRRGLAPTTRQAF